jgi:hypothetical protein
MALNEKKVQVYNAITNMICKLLITLVLIGAFIYVLVYLVQAKDPTDIWKLGAIEAALAGSFYVVVKHHFPDPSKEAEEKRV